MHQKIFLFLLFNMIFIYSENFSVKRIRKEIFIPSKIEFVSQYHDNDKYISGDYIFSVDSTIQHALISTPKTPKPKNGYPVIIMIHGFIQPSHYNTFNSYKYIFNRYANSEFKVVKPDLRGHGRSETKDSYESSLSLLYYSRDILQLIYSLETLDDVDINNIFLMGHSNGGNQVIRVLVSKPNLVKAASLWAPTSVQQEESNFFWRGGGKREYGDTALSLPETSYKIKEIRIEISDSLSKFGTETVDEINFTPYLKDIITPIVIRHPDTDESVPYKWSIDFLDEFKRTGNSTFIKLVNYPGDNHNIGKNQYTAQMEDLKWFRSFLNN